MLGTLGTHVLMKKRDATLWWVTVWPTPLTALSNWLVNAWSVELWDECECNATLITKPMVEATNGKISLEVKNMLQHFARLQKDLDVMTWQTIIWTMLDVDFITCPIWGHKKGMPRTVQK